MLIPLGVATSQERSMPTAAVDTGQVDLMLSAAGSIQPSRHSFPGPKA